MKFNIKILFLSIALINLSLASAGEKGIKLYEDLQQKMTHSMNQYVSALEELYDINPDENMYDSSGNLHINYPQSLKNKISKKVERYIDDMQDSITQVENYLLHSKNNSECLLEINNFKKNKLPILKSDLAEFKMASVLTPEEREITWAKTMVFTLSGPALKYGELALGPFVDCLLL